MLLETAHTASPVRRALSRLRFLDRNAQRLPFLVSFSHRQAPLRYEQQL